MKFLRNKKFRLIIIVLLAVVLIAIGWIYSMLWSPNTSFEEKNHVVFIRHETNLDEWLDQSESNFIADKSSFSKIASLKKFQKVKRGRYVIKKGSGNQVMINKLRSGNQDGITVRIDDVHTLSQLAGRLGSKLMYDSTAFMTGFSNDSIQNSFGLNSYTLPSMIIPDTYEFFWTMTPDEFLKRMKKVSDQFWTTEKIERAQEIKMTVAEISTLASIVKAETAKVEEAPKIAGLYLNRLRIGMALQSDPTAVFGREAHIDRVYLSDLQNDSPYNTYLRTGLPPGPINFSETIYLDAVLNAEKHGYLYMCAQPGGTGFHNFSRTLDQHNSYRREYTNWLEKKGIR